jgi:hypothetical protein
MSLCFWKAQQLHLFSVLRMLSPGSALFFLGLPWCLVGSAARTVREEPCLRSQLWASSRLWSGTQWSGDPGQWDVPDWQKSRSGGSTPWAHGKPYIVLTLADTIGSSSQGINQALGSVLLLSFFLFFFNKWEEVRHLQARQ